MSAATLTPRQERLADALRVAARAADAIPYDDGGSANLDAPFLYARRGLTAKTVEAAAEAAGVSVSRSHGRWWSGWFVHVACGQGASRTRQAEAAANALNTAGEAASVYYALD